MSEINIYYFSDTKEIFDKIFVEKGEILEKNYGSIETRLYSYQTIDTKWIGYKYPNLSDDNKNTILNDLMESIKDNKNKNNIVIKFGQKYAKAFRKLSNKFIQIILLYYLIFQKMMKLKMVFSKNLNILNILVILKINMIQILQI